LGSKRSPGRCWAKLKGAHTERKISKSISKSSDVCDELAKKPLSILESNKLCIAIMFIFYFLPSLVKKEDLSH
jgi:hypothetical protein